MAHNKSSISILSKFDSKILYLAIVAIVLANFIVRIKVYTNQLRYDMKLMPFSTNFFAYYKVIWITLVFGIILMAFIYRIYKYKQKLNKDFILLGTSLIIVSTSVATILSPLKEVSIFGLYSRNNGLLTYFSLFLFIYCLSHFKIEKKHLSFLVYSINIVSIIFVVIGIFQFFGIDMMNSLWFKQIYTPNQYKDLIGNINITQANFPGTEYHWGTSILGQFNYFGAYCSIIFPILTAFALIENKLKFRIFLMLGSVIIFTGTIIAQSMGSIIAMFLVLIAIPIFLVNKYNYKSFIIMCMGYTLVSAIINRLTVWNAFSETYKIIMTLFSSKLLLLTILILVSYLVLFIFRQRIAKYRFVLVAILIVSVMIVGIVAYAYVLENVVESNMRMLSSRGYIWYYSTELIKQNFLTGYGPDNLYYNFPQMNPHKEKFLPDGLVDKPHNMYLQVILDTGIFGLIGFMILLVGTLLKANKAIDLERDIYKNTFLKALMLVVIAYMFQGMVNDNHIVIQPIVYLIIGIGASQIKQTLDHAKLTSSKE
jgi:hypothetical protein